MQFWGDFFWCIVYGVEAGKLSRGNPRALNQWQTTDLVGDAYGALVVAFGHGVIDNHIVVL